jgi:hemerythrin-like domain-containing protein
VSWRRKRDRTVGEPLKRHLALQSLARDHNGALYHALALRRAGTDEPWSLANAIAAFLEAWDGTIERHFDLEEELLLDVLPKEFKEHLLSDHKELRAMVKAIRTKPIAAAAAALGERLREHVRWEDHHMFTAIEATATEAQLYQIGVTLSEIGWSGRDPMKTGYAGTRGDNRSRRPARGARPRPNRGK